MNGGGAQGVGIYADPGGAPAIQADSVVFGAKIPPEHIKTDPRERAGYHGALYGECNRVRCDVGLADTASHRVGDYEDPLREGPLQDQLLGRSEQHPDIPYTKQAVVDEVMHSDGGTTSQSDRVAGARPPEVGVDDVGESVLPEIGVSAGASCADDGGAQQPPGLFRDIFNAVKGSGKYNFEGERRRVPSGLNIQAWRMHLEGYGDPLLGDFLEFGWPVGCDRSVHVSSMSPNHSSALQFSEHIDHYISTECSHGALLGPFDGPPIVNLHISPLMTRLKRDSPHRRVIMDLSFPHGWSVNDSISSAMYVDGPAVVKLPSVYTMERKLLDLGRGAWMYKSDLARGYRQLRVDPADWDLLGFEHNGKFYVDICPPFGLRTSAMMMVRTTQAITHIHGKEGFSSVAYIDDFGGAEPTEAQADEALDALQAIFDEVGLQEASRKVCRPSQNMTWLGINFDSKEMTMTLPQEKIVEIREILAKWENKTRASLKEVQSLFGLLQFVTSVAPPARLFTNRVLETMRELHPGLTAGLSWGFRRDLKFFRDLLADFRGIKLMEKVDVQDQDTLELDACLSGCGAIFGGEFYAREFPADVQVQHHPIAHLETLNLVVAAKVWGRRWAGHRVRVKTDNMNTALALQSGRSRDAYIQNCAREIFMICAQRDVDLLVTHTPGTELGRADALSREHFGGRYAELLRADAALRDAARVHPPDSFFQLTNEL